jgi:hypothetical protein
MYPYITLAVSYILGSRLKLLYHLHVTTNTIYWHNTYSLFLHFYITITYYVV